MKFFKRDIPEHLNNASGIYRITNEVNGKVYVGKTHSFRKRYTLYKACYKRQDIRGINEYFLNAINKYGAENFTFSIIEVCEVSLTAERELFWITTLNSLDKNYGYNLRFDSSTGLIVQQSTRDKMSARLKREFENGTRNAENIGKFFCEFWKENPEIKESMKAAVSEAKSSYFLQSTRDNTPLKLWNGINQIIENNKGYKFQNIYAACNGSKKSYMGFKWKRFEGYPVEYSSYLVDLPFSYGNARLKQTEGIFETDNSPRKAKWVFKITCADDKFVVLFSGLGGLESAVASRFSYHKTEVIKTQGYSVERVAFDATICDFDFLNSEADRFRNRLAKDKLIEFADEDSAEETS